MNRNVPVNALGYLRVMFAVEGLADTIARLVKLGATVVDEVVDYQGIRFVDAHRSRSHAVQVYGSLIRRVRTTE